MDRWLVSCIAEWRCRRPRRCLHRQGTWSCTRYFWGTWRAPGSWRRWIWWRPTRRLCNNNNGTCRRRGRTRWRRPWSRGRRPSGGASRRTRICRRLGGKRWIRIPVATIDRVWGFPSGGIQRSWPWDFPLRRQKVAWTYPAINKIKQSININ